MKTINYDHCRHLASIGSRQNAIAKSQNMASGEFSTKKKTDPELQKALNEGWQEWLDSTGANIFPVNAHAKKKRKYTKRVTQEVVAANGQPEEANTVTLSDTVKFTYNLEGDIFTLDRAGRDKLNWLIEAMRETKRV